MEQLTNRRTVNKAKVYDKERTKKKLINAVGSILTKDGFQHLKITKVEAVSGISRRLMYRYFGNMNGLVKAYLHQVDFWKIEEQKIDVGGELLFPEISKEFIFNLLKEDFDYFNNSPEMQKIVLWGISEKNKTIRALTDGREQLGEQVFRKTDDFFKDSAVDFRATAAIFVAAIYYMVLHARTNGSTMCGIDVSSNEGKNRIFDAMESILDQVYKKSKKNK